MTFGDSVIDDIVRLSDIEIERRISLFNYRCSTIQGNTWQDKINTLNTCNCCSKHQINKPTQLQIWNELPFHNDQSRQCLCNCRHMSRMICRTICGSINNNDDF